MIFLFNHTGKIADDSMPRGITGQTNLVMVRYKLFKDMAQGNQPFLTWWSKVCYQAKHCDFTGYTKVMAARDVILFNPSDSRLRQKVLTLMGWLS